MVFVQIEIYIFYDLALSDLLGAELPNCLKSPKFVIAGAAFFCAFLYSPVYIGLLPYC